MKEKVIRFQGAEYLLIGDLERGGPIATKEQYENGECSFALLKSDGSVWRFRDTIGHRDEIEVVGEYETRQGAAAVIGLLESPTWPWNR